MVHFSIITASYNYENYIKETIESVLTQSYPNWEMIIIDDGSKDNSIEVINEYCKKDSRIKLFTHENNQNKGLIKTVKLGINKAQNDWIVFLESDDTIAPNYLEKKLEVIKQNPEVKFIYNDVNMFGNQKRITSLKNHFKFAKKQIKDNPYPQKQTKCFKKTNIVPTFSVVCCKKELFNDLDFNCPIKAIIDLYLWSQISCKTSLFYMDEKLTNWRMHDSYITKYTKTNYQSALFKHKINLLTLNKKLRIFAPLLTIYFYLNLARKFIIKYKHREKELVILGKNIDVDRILSKIYSTKYHANNKTTKIFGVKITTKYTHMNKTVKELNLILPPHMDIGNRILSIVNMINKYNPKKIKIFWDDKGWINQKLSDIFIIDDMDIKETNKIEEARKWSNGINHLTIITPNHELTTKNQTNLALKYNQIKPEDINEFVKYFKQIRPTAEIEKRIKEVHLPKNYTALQIHNNKDWENYGRNTCLELFEGSIEKAEEQIYLCAMSKEISNYFHDKYPGKFIELPNKDYNSMQDAVVDLFIMSKAKNCIYSYGSTFPELAWWLGGCKSKVETIGTGNNWCKPKEQDCIENFYKIIRK